MERSLAIGDEEKTRAQESVVALEHVERANGAADLQRPFDAAVVIPTVLRPSLEQAVRSVWEQKFDGTIHILVGIDKPLGDKSVLEKIQQGPANCALTVLDLGYSLAARHGGLYSSYAGGSLRTILSYAANSRYVAYLDDDNWWAKDHLATLRQAIDGFDWAFSLRWYVHPQTLEPLCVDEWESVGPDKGCFAERFRGFVDTSSLMLDKLACEEALRWWSHPLNGNPEGVGEDRNVFEYLRRHRKGRGTNRATSYYVISPSDGMDPDRQKWIRSRRDPKPSGDSSAELATPTLRHIPATDSNPLTPKRNRRRKGPAPGASDDLATAATLFKEGQTSEAEAKFRQAVEFDPESHTAHHNLAVTLAKQGKLDEAIQHFQQAVKLDPSAAETYGNLALAYSESGRPKDAAKALGELVRLEPDSFKAHHDLAKLLRGEKELEEAIKHYQEALRIKPDSAEVNHDLAMGLAEAERDDEAEKAYQEALRLKPDYVDAHVNYGVLLEKKGKYDEAVAQHREAIRLRPNSDLAYNNLGVVLAAQRKFPEAIAAYRQALARNPHSIEALNNIGNALRSEGEVDEAIVCLEQAIQRKPHYAEAHNNLAIALVQKGRLKDALAHYERALFLRPDYPEGHLNRALAQLVTGDFDNGWTEYEWRWRGKSLTPRRFPQRRWNGESLLGRTILLYFEQGLGDTLQFVRYAALLKERGAKVILEIQKPLEKILARCPGVDQVVVNGSGDRLPPFDVHAPLLSLPGILGTTSESVPQQIPYLSANPELVEKWKERLGSEGFKIGICWRGNPQHRGDRLRSIPLSQFEGLAKLPGVRLFSLQKDEGRDEIAALAERVPLTDLGPELNDFEDTAAIMRNLDLVISCDSSPVHLAGALGVPVWVAVPFAPDWRWLRDHEQTPWYPTMRLFRQPKPNEWDDVFSRLTDAVRRQLEAKSGAVESVAKEADECYDAGIGLFKEGKLVEAEQKFTEATRISPEHAAAYHNLGVALAMQKKLDQATDAFRRSIELKPEFADAHGNIGLAYLEQGQLDDSIRHLGKALKLGHNPDTANNLGVAYMRKRRPQDAVRSYRQALYQRPDYAEAHHNLASALLIQGKFEEGWAEYEWRWKCKDADEREFKKPRWAGTPLGDRTLLLHAEQGLGDTLQFIRFASTIRQGGGNILIEAPSALTRLLATCPGVDRVVTAGEQLPAFDLHAPLMSAPGLLRTTLATLPRQVPYLFADAQMVERWQKRLESLDGFKVGIAWQGNPHFTGDRERSIPLAQFQALARVDGVRLISLQKGPGVEQLARLDNRFTVIDYRWESQQAADAFMETAALLKNLDLVVTCDTAMAHLAGALGVPVWVAIPFANDWRWLCDREDSPWYPTLRLFRQQQTGDWPGVFQRAADALRSEIAVRKSDHVIRRSATNDSTPQPAQDELAEKFQQQGIAEMAQKRVEAAIDSFREAIRLKPDFAGAYNNLGAALGMHRGPDQAIPCFEKALELVPDSADAAGNLALAFLKSDRFEEAEPHLRKVMSLRGASADDHNHLGIALSKQRKFAPAVEQFERALELRPDFAAAHGNLGDAIRASKGPLEALVHYRRAIELAPTQAEHHNNLGNAWAEAGRLDESVVAYQEALKLKSDYAEVYNNMGVNLGDLHRLDEAAEALQRAIYLQPGQTGTHRNLSIILLLKGDFERGWAEYEWRLRDRGSPANRFKKPMWDGGPIEGRTILLHPEQGLGDTIQFIRYAALVKQRGAKVLVECPKPLMQLFETCPGIDALIPLGEPLPEFDLHIPLMSLPFVFQTRLDTIPADIPYLQAEPALVEQWRNRLGSKTDFKVGVCWQGNPNYGGDRNRSIPFQHFSALADIPGVKLFSLQKGHGRDQLTSQTDQFPIVDLADEINDFRDTAAIIKNLDLVVSCDSSPVHLAGALGRPVWVALCRPSDWRWMRGRNDSPWYPSVRLFQQQRWGDWDEVFGRMAETLCELAQQPRAGKLVVESSKRRKRKERWSA